MDGSSGPGRQWRTSVGHLWRVAGEQLGGGGAHAQAVPIGAALPRTRLPANRVLAVARQQRVFRRAGAVMRTASRPTLANASRAAIKAYLHGCRSRNQAAGEGADAKEGVEHGCQRYRDGGGWGS